MTRKPKSTSKPKKPKTVDDYLSALSADKRAALEKLRKAIRATAPEAEECISYGIPAFRLQGKFLVGFAATARHCSFYLGSTTQAYEKELEGYDLSKGTIRFLASDPLPDALVRKMVKARIAEREAEGKSL